MPPDPDRSLVDSLTDPSRPGVPRVWETAVALRDDSGLPLIRSASSRHHRTAEQEVGQTYTSQIALSKLFDLPEGLTEAGVLVSSGFLDLNLTDPVFVSPDDRVLLHACVIVTVGAARATLVDTQRNQLYLAPLRLGQILEHQRGATGSEILDREPDVREADLYRWLGCLLATDLATTIHEPAENFPVIALGPDQVRDIESAVVDIDADSDFDLAGLVEELDGLGCEHIELRYLDQTNPDVLAADLADTDGSRLRSVQVIAPWTPDWTTEVIEQLCIDHARLARLTLHGAPEATTLGDERYQAALVARRLDGHDGCGQIHPLYFALNLDSVIRSGVGDTCLAGKVGVDARGVIRNCPSHPIARGRIGQDRLADVVATDSFAEPGSLTKAEVDGCRVCEFRSVCSHCQVQAADPAAKPDTCRYDPKTGRWSS